MNPTHLLKSINEEFTTHVPQEMLLAASSVEGWLPLVGKAGCL